MRNSANKPVQYNGMMLRALNSDQMSSASGRFTVISMHMNGKVSMQKMDLLLRIAKVVDMNAQEWKFTRILWQLKTIDIDGEHFVHLPLKSGENEPASVWVELAAEIYGFVV
jgi:hypothetical protein